MVDPRHKMILSSGRFSGTSREQLTAAFDAFASSAETHTLVVHFHGEFVSESAAEGIAERLLPIYQGAGGYPLFVIWQSGLGETLKNNWRQIIEEDAFSILVERVLQFVIGQLDQAPGERGDEVELPTRFAVKDEIQQKQAAGEEPFVEREAEVADLDAELAPAQQAQFESLLAGDASLESAAIRLNRPDAPELNPTLEAELEQARATEEPGERALVSTTLLVTAGVRILARVLRRFAKGRDHGIYTTVVEEVARELMGDLVGGIVWKSMKRDTADAFEGPGDTHGGTALLKEIGQLWQTEHKLRIVLIGHSAGAVYICHLLEKASMLPDDIRFEVVWLAPACSFELLDRTLAAASNRIAFFRSFGMNDEIEKRDAVFPPLYLRSFLYFVSGVVEETVDLPLVGMERYHTGAPPFDTFPEINRVHDRSTAFAEPWIWSESQAGPGLSTLARKHGDFDDDPKTLESVAYVIAQGGA
jgi:hypothetical protein